MRKTTTALFAAAVMVGAGQAQAQQQRDAGSWWTPAVLSLAQQVAQTVDGERPRWTRTGDARTRDRAETERTRTDRGFPTRSDRDDDRYDRDDDRYEARGKNAGKKGNGPPFCRNGQGHPTKGMQWCRDKGWAGGYDRDDRYDSRRDRRDGGWTRSGWEDVILGAPTRGDRRITQPDLMDILGGVVMGRLADHGRSTGLGGAMDARWVASAVGDVLQLRMGGQPLAELTDRNRDGRADVILLRN